ncbi:MAG TPA: PAS domain S-box protein [Solimonas sp.]
MNASVVSFPGRTRSGAASRWQRAVEGSGLGVWEWDIGDNRVFYSDQWKEMLGYTRDEIGDGLDEWSSRVHPDDLPKARADLQAHLDGRVALYASESRMRCKDGSYKWILDRGQVIERDAEGQPLRMVGTHVDVTRSKQAESALTESQTRFRAVFNSMFQLIGVLAPDGTALQANEAALQFGGLTQDDIVGRKMWELSYFQTSPETVDTTRRAVEAAARGEFVRTEIEILGRDGQRMPIDFSVKPVFDEQGRVTMLIPEGRDILERKRTEAVLRESEERFRRTFFGAPVGTALVALDGRWLAVNPALCAILGYDEDELMRLTFQDITHPDDLESDLAQVARTLFGEIAGYRMFKRYLRKDGRSVPTQLDVSLIRTAVGQPMQFVAHIQDISDRKRFEDLLQQEKERFQVALSSITDAVLITDIHGAVGFVNPIAEDLLGRPAPELLALPLDRIIELIDEDGVSPLTLMRPEPAQTAAFRQGVAQMRRGVLPAITVEYALAPLKDAEQALIGYVCTLHDVTQTHALTRALEHQAAHDPLTGLLNRSGFERELERQRQGAEASDRPWCLLYLDLDRFKIVNDTAGHAAGDRLLCALARRLRAVLRASDVFARLGGDEFGVILRNCGAAQAERIAAKLIETVDNFRFHHDERQFQLGLSVGIAVPGDDPCSVADLLRMADTACYVAKRTGRNRACLYRERDIDGLAPVAEFNAVNELQLAFDEQRLRVYAQKIVDLDSGRTVGVELLTRMMSPEGQIVAPERFLPVAERNDLVTRLDSWMLRQAATLFGGAGASLPSDWFVTVNVSGLSISDLRFHRVISEVMSGHGALRDRIYFEITESAAPSNWMVTRQGIELLRSHGSRVLLDDFGSGFTSFNYLRDLRVDGLKIAQDFTGGIAGDPINEPVVSMVAQLARHLDIYAIAEGVEDEQAAQELRERHIRYAQGFHFHRPEPVANLLVAP